mgnify:CR=1 FL=1
MKVSVIVPAWGETPYLKETLDALALQTLRDFEIVRCEPPEDEKNAGAARNSGIARAKGEWIWFLDADDVPVPTLLEECVAVGERTGADIVVFRADELDAKSGRRSPMPYLERIVPYADGKNHRVEELGCVRFTTFGLAPWNKLVRREIVEKHALRFQSLPRSNDVAFSVELMASAGTFVALNRSLLAYRVNNETSLQHTNAQTPTAFVDALEEADRRLAGRFSEAFAVLQEETVRYHLHSVRTLSAYRELTGRLGLPCGLKGSCRMLFRFVRNWETLRDRGAGFCLRRFFAGGARG